MAMDSSQNTMSNFVSSYARWLLRYKWLVVILTLPVVFAAASGGRFLTFSSDFEVYFTEENPQLQSFDRMQRVYTKRDNVLFVIQPASGSVFTSETLEIVDVITQGGWQIPYATRVDSLTNYQHTRADGDDLIVADLVEEPQALGRPQLEAIKAVALNEPLLVGSIVSEDGRTTGIDVTVNLPEGPAAEKATEEIITASRELLARARGKSPDLKIVISGGMALNNAFTEVAQRDNAQLLPIMVIIILVLTALFLRTFSGVLGIACIVAFSGLIGMGLAGWFGIVLVTFSAFAPIMIATIAVADGIHILVTAQHFARSGLSRDDAIIQSLELNAAPIFLTSVTTIVGFLSLNFSDTPPFRDLGNIVSMGVCAAWMISMTFLPALAALFPLKARPDPLLGQVAHLLDHLGVWVIANRKVFLAGFSGLTVIAALLIPRLEINDEFVEYFHEDTEFHQSADFAADNLIPIQSVLFSVGSGEAGGVSDPGYLQQLSDFSDWLRARPDVAHVTTLTDTIKRLNMNLHGDDPSYYRLPDNRELAAQYLLLYEMSLPYGLDLNNQINVDKSATRVIAALSDGSSSNIKVFKAEAEAWLTERSPDLIDIEGASPSVMFAFINQQNSVNMLVGTAVAMALISLTLIIALRSYTMGILTLVPNCLPIIVAFGIWAIVEDSVNMASSVVAAVCLGLIVDATVHFVSKYLHARRGQKKDGQSAILYAYRTAGLPIALSAMILIGGFITLSFSYFEVNSVLGQLSAVLIVMALAVDFLFYPALLFTFDRETPAAKT